MFGSLLLTSYSVFSLPTSEMVCRRREAWRDALLPRLICVQKTRVLGGLDVLWACGSTKISSNIGNYTIRVLNINLLFPRSFWEVIIECWLDEMIFRLFQKTFSRYSWGILTKNMYYSEKLFMETSLIWKYLIMD